MNKNLIHDLKRLNEIPECHILHKIKFYDPSKRLKCKKENYAQHRRNSATLPCPLVDSYYIDAVGKWGKKGKKLKLPYGW